MIIIDLEIERSQQSIHFQMPQEQIIIGPLVFKRNVPNLIITRTRCDLDTLFGTLSRTRVTDLSLTHGRLNLQMQKIEELKQWIQKYEFLSLVNLNCSHNELPTLLKLSIFQLPRLQSLNLSDCYIQDFEGLARCEFPLLSSLTLFNNHLVSLRSFRKLKAPFLSQFVIDSNHLIELKGISEITLMFLNTLQIHNNQLITIRSLIKANFPRLTQLRAQNHQACVQHENKLIGEQMVYKKFSQLN